MYYVHNVADFFSRFKFRWFYFAVTTIVGLLLISPFVFGMAFYRDLSEGPMPSPSTDISKKTVIFYDAEGEEMGIRGPHRRDVEITTLPAHVLNAFVAIEDRRFFYHSGIDPIGIARALRANMQAGMIVEGGSTITQQLVKNIYLDSERTMSRKFEEAILALRLEQRMSKADILEEYLYTVYFGNNAYGIEAAANAYFGKTAAELTVAEAAILAGSIKAPGRYAPHIAPDEARERARVVLNAMAETGHISLIEEQMAAYELARIELAEPPAQPEGYSLDYAFRTLETVPAAEHVVHVETTIDREFQAAAEQAIAKILTESVRENQKVSQAALVAMRPTGEIVALVGGLDYRESQFDRATQAKRQPGSLFKAFVYDAAMRRGWDAEDMIVDARITLDIPDKRDELYQPANYNNSYNGLISTRRAFASSANSAALRLQEWTGRENVIKSAERAGLDANLKPWPSLGLGVMETTLLDITAAYGSLGANRLVEPYILKEHASQAYTRLSEPQPDFLRLMYDNVQAGTGYRTKTDVPSFGKTGTTQDYRDAWYVGFNDNLIVGVWVGNDGYEEMNDVTGGTIPAQIWKEFIVRANEQIAREENPARMTQRPLVEIALHEEKNRSDEEWWQERPVRMIGPIQIASNGNLSMGGKRLFMDHIQPVSSYGSYYQAHDEMQNYVGSIEAACEVYQGYADCQAGTKDVAEYILERGWARTYYNAPAQLRYAEERAREEGRGIWGDQYRYQTAQYDPYAYYDMEELNRRQREEIERQRRNRGMQVINIPMENGQQQGPGSVSANTVTGQSAIDVQPRVERKEGKRIQYLGGPVVGQSGVSGY